MKTYHETILGADCTVRVVESSADVDAFLDWVADNASEVVAVDTESTGLNVYASDWRLRSVQFGTLREAWVIWVEGSSAFPGAARYALDNLQNTVAHNRPYDGPALDVAGYRHRLWQGRDTMLMAHLVDSRGKEDGGIGHGLKDLAAHYIDPDLLDSDEALKQWAKSNGIKLEDRYAMAPDRLPELERYAGVDVLLTRALHDLLSTRLTEMGQWELLAFEEELQHVCSEMAERGLRLDKDYAVALHEYLLDREDILAQQMDEMGIENPNSATQVRKALVDAGVKLTARTPSGKDFSVNKEALEGVDHPAAALVQEYRHVTKFNTSYVEKSLELVDANGRVHPSIRSLKARTARMAVSSPPLHQLPSGDPLIRRMYIADEGHSIISADYSQVELRVLAELAQEKAMLKAIANDVDLHTNTAELVGISRKVAKMTNFLIVYGGGASKLAAQAAIPEDEAKAALRGFHRAFPGVRRYGNRLQDRTGKGARALITPSGRHIIVDRDRSYAVLNYNVQSTARDVLGEAMLDLVETPYGRGMLLPMHDELVAQAPSDEAEEWARELGRLMSTDFGSTFLEAEGEVYGPSWGHGYIGKGEIPKQLERWF